MLTLGWARSVVQGKARRKASIFRVWLIPCILGSILHTLTLTAVLEHTWFLGNWFDIHRKTGTPPLKVSGFCCLFWKFQGLTQQCCEGPWKDPNKISLIFFTKHPSVNVSWLLKAEPLWKEREIIEYFIIFIFNAMLRVPSTNLVLCTIQEIYWCKFANC